MDSNDIYYSDNSQLIESNNTEWINNTVLVENEDISWNDTGPEITVDYSESTSNIDHTLNNTDGYETADAGDNSETSQYFSILDSTITENVNSLEENPKCVLNVEIEKEETILPDITANAESEIEELNLDDKISENEVILYRPAGSEELFAVQIAEDEHGNLQKYKFKVKQNEDGQFEAIPGTMEVESANEMNNSAENLNEANPDFEDFVEEKHNPMILNSNATADEQGLEFINDNVENEENSDMEIDYIQNENLTTSESVNNASYEQDQDDEYQTVDGIHVTGDSDTNSRHDYVEELTVSNINEHAEDDSEEEYEVEELEEAFQDDNTNDAYEDGITHIQNILNSEIREYHTSSVLQHKANISNLKIPILESENLKHNVTIYKDDKHLSYLVVKGKEKENVLLDRKSKFNTINMRSILKCNNPSFVPDKFPLPKVEKPQHSVPSIISNKDSNTKHIIKPKEIMSPVKSKSARQPRKQRLNPVNRVGSEIIVQPLVYSVDETGRSDNSLMPPSKHKRILPEVLQVSDDSDPEFVLKPQTRKRKRGRPRKRQNSVEITILDSDEEEKSETNSVIEVPSDQESNATDNENENDSEPIKLNNSEKNVSVKEVDKVESRKADENTKVNKNIKNSSPFKKNKCPLCPKTFPRLVTLKRHINMHNIRKSLRSKQNITPNVENKQNLNTKVSEIQDKPSAYNCKKCKLKFLLESQYKRHQTIHISKKPVDKLSVINKKLSPKKNIEKHVFSGSRYLRSNSKITNEQMPSLTEKKKNKKVNPVKNHFKCEYCGQSYSTRALLFSHRNTHKTFPCPNCKTTFTAKILLDDHLRKNCVKSPVKGHRQSVVTKKAIFKKTFVKCETCSRVFPNQKSLQIHNSVSHRRRSYVIPAKIPSDISEKEIGMLITNKMPHGGVPMSLKMQQAFDKMKQKT